MATCSLDIRNKKNFTLADLPALEEARRQAQQNSSQPASPGLSCRIVSLNNLTDKSRAVTETERACEEVKAL